MWKAPRTQPQCSTSGNSRGGAREPGGIHSGASSSKGCCESRRGTRKIGAFPQGACAQGRGEDGGRRGDRKRVTRTYSVIRLSLFYLPLSAFRRPNK